MGLKGSGSGCPSALGLSGQGSPTPAPGLAQDGRGEVGAVLSISSSVILTEPSF